MTNLIPVTRWYDPNKREIIDIAGIPNLPPEDVLGDPNPTNVTYTQYDRYGRGYTGNLFSGSLLDINVKLLHDDSTAPTRGHATDAGLDFYSYEDITIPPFGEQYRNPISGELVDAYRILIPTGVAVQVPHGFGLFLWDRSGMSAKYGQHRVAGVIDSSYTGEVKVALVNLSQKPFDIAKGDRIVQGVISPILLPKINIVDELQTTERGAGGFGSTGA